MTLTSPTIDTSERFFHPHHTPDVIPGFLVPLTRQLQNLLKLSEFAGGQSPLNQSLSQSPAHTLSRSLTCPPLDLQRTPLLAHSSLGWGIGTKGDFFDCAKSLAPATPIVTYPLKYFRKYRNRISRVLSSINFPGSPVSHCSLLSGLLRL